MKFTAKIAPLTAALATANGMAERKSTMAILQNVLLKVEKGRLTIAASDLTGTAESVLEVDDSVDGATSINAKWAFDLIKDLPGDTLTARRLETGNIEIKAGRAKYSVATLAATEFPKMPSAAKVVFAEVDPVAFRRMIESVKYAALSDSARQNLSGAYLVREGANTTMVCLDTKRLAMMTAPIGDIRAEDGILIPNKALSDILRLISDEKEKIKVGFSGQVIFTRVGDTTISSKLFDGSQYPPFREAMSQPSNRKATVHVTPFCSMLKRVGSMDPTAEAVDLYFSAEMVTCEAAGLGGAGVEELDIEYEGEPLKIRFNPRFLIQALESLGEPKAIMKFDKEKEDKGALVIEAENGNGPTCGLSPMGPPGAPR